jgi:hypothetical protein
MFGKKNNQGGLEDCVAVPGQKNNKNTRPRVKRLLITKESIKKRKINSAKIHSPI